MTTAVTISLDDFESGFDLQSPPSAGNARTRTRHPSPPRQGISAMTTAVTISLDDFESGFDLFAAIEKSQELYDKHDEATIKYLSLYKVPKYVRANLDRVIAGEGVSHEEARWCCIEYGVRRIFASREFQEWEKLYEIAISKETRYDNDGDWDDVLHRLDTFSFKPSDVQTGTYTTNARIPDPIKSQVGRAAKVLGMSASAVAIISFIEALRNVRGVMHWTDMDRATKDFYSQLRRWTRRLRNLLVEVGAIEPGQKL